MARRALRSKTVPKVMRTLVIAASGLAVGIAITVVRTWQPDTTKNSTTEISSVESSSSEALAKGESTPAKGKAMLPTNIPTLSGAGAGSPGLVAAKELKIPLPLSCLDARRKFKGEVCEDADLRAKTSIDWAFQDRVASFMRRKPVVASAYVALDIKTGGVRALVSHEPGLTKPSREALASRAPAASIFKIISAAALLRNGVHAETSVCTHGGARGIKEAHLRENPRLDKTCESLKLAFAKSRNAVFARLAAGKLNQEKLKDEVTTFGFNGLVPFNYPLDPSTAEVPKGRLARAKMAAGFSAVSLNPGHAALIGATIARDGTFPLPILDRSLETPTKGTRVISKSVSRALQKMMKTTVTKGTGRRTLMKAKISSGAKSGTLSAYRDGKLRQYTWMVGYFPADDPEIAYAAMVANTEIWHIRAGDLARAGLDAYARLSKTRK